MTEIPTTPAQRLRAIDQSLGVSFRPVAAQTTGGQSTSSTAAPASLESIEAKAQQAFPFTNGLASASQLVFGEGNPEADLVFVGEAPGADEDRTGRPFVGAAGQKLDEIIAAMGLRRDAVYICNVLKARPPKNRAPLPDEIAACAPFLHAQLQCIQPAAIVALGGPAAKFLLDTDEGISRLRGRWGAWRNPQTKCVGRCGKTCNKS